MGAGRRNPRAMLNESYNQVTFSYLWKMKDGYPAPGIEKHNRTAFGTFICGGGSSMGYKLAGFNHLGGVEIDQKIASVYQSNHSPKYLYVESVRDFNERDDLPDELFNLDLLDGSPPCSSFSFAGKRQKQWGKKKVFAEGQSHQRLDDLVFAYVETILKLTPKTFVLENVKGMISGNAKAYTRKICETLICAGYRVQAFLLDSASMGVPQRRPRVFIIGSMSSLNFPPLKLGFTQREIQFREVSDPPGSNRDLEKKVSQRYRSYWDNAKEGEAMGKFGSVRKLWEFRVARTLMASHVRHYHPTEPRQVSDLETVKMSSFPIDYDFGGSPVSFICGMSVPPVMMANVAYEIYRQWLVNV